MSEDLHAVYGITFPPEWADRNPGFLESLEEMLVQTRKRRARVPRGYVLSSDGATCVPNKELLLGYLQALIDYRYNQSRSLRETQEYIYTWERKCGIESPAYISLGGVASLFDRMEKDLGVLDKELTSERLKKVRNERIAKAKKEGKSRPYHNTTANKVKKDQITKLATVSNELKKLKDREQALKRQAARAANKLNDTSAKISRSMKNDPHYLAYLEARKSIKLVKKAPVVHTPTDIVDRYNLGLRESWDESLLLEIYNEILDKRHKYSQRSIAFLPTPRQYLFLSAPEDIVLYGGAAGGGKSHAMLMDAVRFANYRSYRGVIIRKTTRELRDLIDKSYLLYKTLYPKASYNATEGVWKFPSGAKIEFGFLDNPTTDKFKYQGQEYQYAGFDELSQQATDEGFKYVRSRLRRPEDPNVNMIPYLRATANPGSLWVYEMFIKDKEPNVPFILPGTEKKKLPTTVRFIPAMLDDNPYLARDGAYKALLESLGGIETKQLLEGDWLASVDNMFPEFRVDTHVVEPYFIPRHWNKFAGIDYGYRDPSAVVWIAVNPDDGTLVVYKELLETGLTGRELGLAIRSMEQDELLPVDHIIDGSVYAKTGHTGPTIAEDMFRGAGIHMRRADKNREAGWVQLHEYLRPDPVSGYPKIQIQANCTQLIKQLLSAKINPRRPNDLDDKRNSDGHWDLLDALRYAVMSRPRQQSIYQDMATLKKESSWKTIDSYFS